MTSELPPLTSITKDGVYVGARVAILLRGDQPDTYAVYVASTQIVEIMGDITARVGEVVFSHVTLAGQFCLTMGAVFGEWTDPDLQYVVVTKGVYDAYVAAGGKFVEYD